MSREVYRAHDYSNPRKYHDTYSRPYPLVVSMCLAALTISLGIACLLGLAAGA